MNNIIPVDMPLSVFNNIVNFIRDNNTNGKNWHLISKAVYDKYENDHEDSYTHSTGSSALHMSSDIKIYDFSSYYDSVNGSVNLRFSQVFHSQFGNFNIYFIENIND